MNDAKVPNKDKVNTVMEGIDIFIKIAEETDKLETTKNAIIDGHNDLADKVIKAEKKEDVSDKYGLLDDIENKMNNKLPILDKNLAKLDKQGNELSKKMEKVIDNLSSDEKDLVVSELDKRIERAEQEHYLASETKKMGYLDEQEEKARNEEINRYEISIEAYKYFRDLLGPISYEIVKPGSR